MLINNVASYIRSPENQELRAGDTNLTAFTASEVLGIALCKAKEEVLADIVSARPEGTPLVDRELRSQLEIMNNIQKKLLLIIEKKINEL